MAIFLRGNITCGASRRRKKVLIEAHTGASLRQDSLYNLGKTRTPLSEESY